MKKALFILFITLLSQTLTAQPWGDYMLYGDKGESHAYLVDTSCARYRTWRAMIPSGTGYACYMMPGGKLLRAAEITPRTYWLAGGVTGDAQIWSWEGVRLWDYILQDATRTLHHDLCAMPNGHILMIAYEFKTPAELDAAGDISPDTTWVDMIMEVEPIYPSGGNVVWEWHLWDHLCQNTDSTKSNYVSSISQHPELMNVNYPNNVIRPDWMHVNGIDYNDSLDQITFSSRYNNEIYVIDHSTTTAQAATHSGGRSGMGGDFLYRWGNPAAYGITSQPTQFNVVHDAHWIPRDCPRANSLVGFNNLYTTTQSAVQIFMPPYDGYRYTFTPGVGYGPAAPDRTIPTLGRSLTMGNSQQLPNGNTLICVAQNAYIYEIDSLGNRLWDCTSTVQVAQAFKYEKCWLRDTPRDTPVIFMSYDTLFTDPDSTYQWFENGVAVAGATGRSYVPGHNGVFQVLTTDRYGCPSYISDTFLFSALNIDSDYFNSRIRVLPNPTIGPLKILHALDTLQRFDVSIFDVNGRLVTSGSKQTEFDLSAEKSGVYTVQITSEFGVTSRKVVLINQ